MRQWHAQGRFLLTCWAVSFTLISLLLSATSLDGAGPVTLGAPEYLTLQLMCAIIAAWITFLSWICAPPGRALAFWILSYAGCIGTVFGVGLGVGWFLPEELLGPGVSASLVYAATGLVLWRQEVRTERRINERLARLRDGEADK